jgi:sugar lactone lactonase YvrE
MTRRIVLSLAAAAIAAGLVLGAAFGQSGGGSEAKTWTTVFKSPISIEGLTNDDDGRLYVPQRGGAAGCNIVRISSTGGANQSGVVVARMAPPCSPAGLAFGPDGRLYLTGFGDDSDEIGVVRPNASNPPLATRFATGTPGGNGVAFDEDGNLYISDGVRNEGRVFRVGRSGGEATVLFRVPAMTNTIGVGRQNRSLPPDAAQGIVANGLAFDRDGNLFVADTARGALWRVELSNRGALRTRTDCDPTYPDGTLCLDALFVQHLALEGADGIAVDRDRNVYVDANERNAIVVVDRRGQVSEFFRNPVGAENRRNGGPLEAPTSPVLAGRKLCTTSSDLNRRDNFPNTAGEANGAAVLGKVSCLDQRLDEAGLDLPVDD